MTTERFYVRIGRDDGSRTYKGAWSLPHCQREAAAWTDSFPTYEVEILTARDTVTDVRTWQRTTRDGNHYYPAARQAARDLHDAMSESDIR